MWSKPTLEGLGLKVLQSWSITLQFLTTVYSVGRDSESSGEQGRWGQDEKILGKTNFGRCQGCFFPRMHEHVYYQYEGVNCYSDLTCSRQTEDDLLQAFTYKVPQKTSKEWLIFMTCTIRPLMHFLLSLQDVKMTDWIKRHTTLCHPGLRNANSLSVYMWAKRQRTKRKSITIMQLWFEYCRVQEGLIPCVTEASLLSSLQTHCTASHPSQWSVTDGERGLQGREENEKKKKITGWLTLSKSLWWVLLTMSWKCWQDTDQPTSGEVQAKTGQLCHSN